MKPIVLPDPTSERDYRAIDPLDGRYYDADIARYLSERSRIAYQAYVEAALARTLAEFDVCPMAVAEEIEAAAAAIKAEDVYAQEQATRHDIKALVNCIKAGISDRAKPYVHFGATSYDIIMTAQALQLRDATQMVVIPRLKSLLQTLLDIAERYAETVQIGRTHGQHAVPVTFGFAVAEYVDRLGTAVLALQDLSGRLCGKFSGAVGAYNALSLFVDDPLAFEKSLLKHVGLEPAPYSTQIIPAEGTVRLIDELAVASGIMANLGHDMRHLQRTEIAEVRERFEPGQTGSSTMAHKRNPWNFENVVSINKQIISQVINANLNLSSEHQRDLTDSASARFYPLVWAGVASMAIRLNSVMARLEVDETTMQRNLILTGGAIAAEPLYLLLEKYGHTEAHEVSKQLAHAALESNKSLYEVVVNSPDINDYWLKFTDREKEIIKSPERLYTGLAAHKTRKLVEGWRQRLA